MDTGKIISALDSDARLKIVQIIAKGSSNVNDVIEALKKDGYPVKYRETVYRSLELLTDAEILIKGYSKEKGISYKLGLKKITINLETGEIK